MKTGSGKCYHYQILNMVLKLYTNNVSDKDKTQKVGQLINFTAVTT